MIDIHSHILPGVDDGARTIDESFEMLNRIVDQGVHTQVLTPHIHIGRYDNTQHALEQSFNTFQANVKDAGFNIHLRLAAEVRIGPEIMPLVMQNQIPWLGTLDGKKVFLLEFPRIDVPHGSDNLVNWLIGQNIMPLIVHPERNRTFVDHPEKLEQFIKLGCPLQVTASSLRGKFGEDVKAMAFDLIEQDKVFAIASDCHNLKGRAPDLASVHDLKNLDAATVKKLTLDNPARLFN
ncbi:tyrosine-protein phosphatase [Ningiella sp. W23]|uniref:tyrosine-protein phosphatase n=1 Tax=Ningiella sp. W23 TaxID=3023715 RepID=UPI00375721B4